MSNKSIDAIAQEQAKTWKAASDRAELRNEPVLALIFRNVAYSIERGKLSLDADQTTQDIQIQDKETVNV